MFGDPTEFPVINSIVRIINENHNNNIRKYCISTIQQFRVATSHVNHMDKPMRRYFMKLIKTDFCNRIDTSGITGTLRDNMRNLIFAIHNSILRKMGVKNVKKREL